MSRIGRQPIAIPDGVKVDLRDGTVEVSGPKGRLSWTIPAGVSLRQEGDAIVVHRESNQKEHRALHGLTRALVSNMVEGVSKGFTEVLEISGTGYRVEEAGESRIKLSLGYSHPIDFVLPEGVTARIEERGTRLILEGIDKQVVGETAARIRRLRPPDAYKGKGIKYARERLRLKAGKSGIKGQAA